VSQSRAGATLTPFNRKATISKKSQSLILKERIGLTSRNYGSVLPRQQSSVIWLIRHSNPPIEPELGVGRGAANAYDLELRAFNAYKLLENQCRVFLIQKLSTNVRREVLDGTSRCRDIWRNLVLKFQVKVENDVADLKA
jgi:hypothetical protein